MCCGGGRRCSLKKRAPRYLQEKKENLTDPVLQSSTKEEPVIQELVTEFPNELKHSPEMDVAPHPLCSVTVKGEPDETDTDLPFKTALKTEVVDLEETFIEDVDPEVSPKKLKYSHPMDLSAQPFSSVTVKSEQEEVDIDLSFEISPKTEVDNLNQEPVIQELATENPKELKHSPQMDAPPRPLCTVTVKGEPDETDTDLPFKTALKTEVVDLEETVVQEQVPEFPKETRYSPPADSSSIPFSSEDVKSEPEEVDTDLSFNISPGTAEEDIKTEMSDDVIVIDEDSSDGTSSDCASYSLPSSSGEDADLSSKDELIICYEVIAPFFPYSCSQCQIKFRNGNQYRRHVRRHCTSKNKAILPNFCPACKCCFQNKHELRSHIRSIHERCTSQEAVNSPYSCWRCTTKIKNKCHLRSHLYYDHQIKSEEVVFSCSVCNKIYIKRTDFMKHILELHSRVNTHVCPVCRETFHSCWDLHEHLATYSDSSSYSCPRCDLKFPTRTTLEWHMTSEEEQSRKIGSIKVHDRSALNEHNKTNPDVSHKSYSKRRVRHVSALSDDNLLDCHKCGRKFPSQLSLIGHLRLHKSCPYMCDTCKEMFPRRSHLKYHLATTNAGCRSFTCSKCQRCFITASDRDMHEKAHREGNTWTMKRLPLSRS